MLILSFVIHTTIIVVLLATNVPSEFTNTSQVLSKNSHRALEETKQRKDVKLLIPSKSFKYYRAT